MNIHKKELEGWLFLQLIYALRQVEFSISLSDVENALGCLKQFPNLDPKAILKANFVHSSNESQLFDSIWSMLLQEFSLDPEPTGEVNIPRTEQIAPGGQGVGRGFGGISVSPNSSGLGNLLVSSQNIQVLLKMMPQEVEAMDGKDQIQWLLGQMDVHQILNLKELSYQRGDITEEELQQVIASKAELETKIRQQLLWNRIQSENDWEHLKTEHWLHKPLESFSQEEKSTVQQALRILGKRLAQRAGFRKKASHHGEMNIQNSIQELVRGNGHIFRLHFHTRVPLRPELVVLCDISNSVLPYSEFLLFLVSHLKLRFRKIRLFLFIDSLWDITHEEDFNNLDLIHAWSHRNSSGYSDYGKVFSEFQTDWLPIISSQATLLILGDARNNYRPAQAEYLQEIHSKVSRVYWLNPLDERDWYTTDNVLKAYLPYCSDVFRCRTVKDLQRLSRRIF